MKALVFISNLIFVLSNWLRYWLFINRAKVGRTQERILLSIIDKNKSTTFGRAHQFDTITSVSQYQDLVPRSSYDDLEPYVQKIMAGQEGSLTVEQVQSLVPTSGTTSKQKLIPFTSTLRKQFSVALNNWIFDLYKSFPQLVTGRQFWIVSPQTKPELSESVVPVRFEDDSSYFGVLGRYLIKKIKVVPDGVIKLQDPDNYLYVVGCYLLKCRDLKLISVWNPSLLLVIKEIIDSNLDKMATDLVEGRLSLPNPVANDVTCVQQLKFSPNVKRGQYIRTLASQGTNRASDYWPKLRVISCWLNGWASKYDESLQVQFPRVIIQPKGLLATEAVVTIPIQRSGYSLLTYDSHFYEFRDIETDKIVLADDLKAGKRYEVLVTTGGGLYRYCLHDIVEVRGFFNGVPGLAFEGKSNVTADLTGEKLSEIQVSEVINQLASKYFNERGLAFMGVVKKELGHSYALFIDESILPSNADLAGIQDSLDDLLRKNFHFDHSRHMKQLSKPGLALMDSKQIRTFRTLKYNKGVSSVSKHLALEMDHALLAQVGVDIKWNVNEEVINSAT